jgi:hypothetical protein
MKFLPCSFSSSIHHIVSVFCFVGLLWMVHGHCILQSVYQTWGPTATVRCTSSQCNRRTHIHSFLHKDVILNLNSSKLKYLELVVNLVVLKVAITCQGYSRTECWRVKCVHVHFHTHTHTLTHTHTHTHTHIYIYIYIYKTSCTRPRVAVAHSGEMEEKEMRGSARFTYI